MTIAAKPNIGALVQIWDSCRTTPASHQLFLHGRMGLVVGYGKPDPNPASSVARIVCFGDCFFSEPVEFVHHGWLRVIKKPSDIKKRHKTLK
jgi:hypothetical protein